MKVGLIFKNITTTPNGLAGGGDVFMVYLLRALKEKGHKVILSVTKPTQWDIIEKDLGWIYKPDEERERGDSERINLYRQFICTPHVSALKEECDVTFNAYGHNLFWNTDLIYMHTPPTEAELQTKYMQNLLTSSYFNVYRYLAKHKDLKTRILANSEYSRKIIQETLNRDAEVVYPPIDTAKYRVAVNSAERENWVVVVSRFTWEKNLRLIPLIAKEVEDATFHIIGNSALTHSSQVIRDIEKRCSELGVQGRVHIHTDISFREKMSILSKSKVYINTLREEHFGMSIAEAMSAGLIPIVPDAGGQREIVPREFLYRDVGDAVAKIRLWLKDWSLNEAFGLSHLAERFSYEKFREKIGEVIEFNSGYAC